MQHCALENNEPSITQTPEVSSVADCMQNEGNKNNTTVELSPAKELGAQRNSDLNLLEGPVAHDADPSMPTKYIDQSNPDGLPDSDVIVDTDHNESIICNLPETIPNPVTLPIAVDCHQQPQILNNTSDMMDFTVDLSNGTSKRTSKTEQLESGQDDSHLIRPPTLDFLDDKLRNDMRTPVLDSCQSSYSPTLVPPKPSSSNQFQDHLVKKVPSEIPDDFVYHIKWIMFKNRRLPIITQNENGPCPMIAIANILFLRGSLTLSQDSELITGRRLMSLLTESILSETPEGLDGGQLLNYETNVSDALSLFPNLQTGLDVNVRFTGVSEFEYTSALGVFDLFKIPIYHGWLLDPVEFELASIIGNRTYNQLVEEMIRLKNSEDSEEIGKGLMVENFLDRTASQLTLHGLCQLASAIQDEQLSVLFRNNHFHTIYKHEGRIYALITDMGLLNEPNIVWEMLNDVDGDTQFVDSVFKLYCPQNSPKSVKELPDMEKLSLNPDNTALQADFESVTNVRESILSDYEISKILQADEYTQAEALQTQRKQANSPVSVVSSTQQGCTNPNDRSSRSSNRPSQSPQNRSNRPTDQSADSSCTIL